MREAIKQQQLIKKNETDIVRKMRLKEEKEERDENPHDVTDDWGELWSRPFWYKIGRKLDFPSLEAFTKGNILENCLFIRDHDYHTRGKKYAFLSWSDNNTDKRQHIPFHKCLRFYLNIGGLGNMKRKANQHCRKLESTKGKHLCVNPFHYGCGDEFSTMMERPVE
jgi:hypothetical protein